MLGRRRARLLVGALGVLLLLIVLSAAGATTAPRACHLFTRGLAEDYFTTNMTRATATRQVCDYASKQDALQRSGNLNLVAWRRAANARTAIDAACKGSKRLSIRGADESCGGSGPTGLCRGLASGQGSGCLFQVTVNFRRGSVTGSLELAALHAFTPNNMQRAATLAQRVLARWGVHR